MFGRYRAVSGIVVRCRPEQTTRSPPPSMRKGGAEGWSSEQRERGQVAFSWRYEDDAGRPVSATAGARAAATITVRFADGSVDATVERTT